MSVSNGSYGSPRLSSSSPGRLLLRQGVELNETPEIELVAPSAQRSHARRESYSSVTMQQVFMEPIGEATSAQFGEESERQLFTPPAGSLTTVRRIVRGDGSSGHTRQPSKGSSAAIIDHASPVFVVPTTNGRFSPPAPALRREGPLNTSSTSIPMGDLPLTQSAAKHLSCCARIIPNIALILILSTIWLVILVYGEYAYPHSHSQFCNSYLPRESLLGRVVVIANPNVAQLSLKSGFFDFFYNFRTRIDSFLSDLNMRRNYRILHEKCSPDAFIFTGSLVVPTPPDTDDPTHVIDEEAYIRLYKRWNWIFTKPENVKFLYAPSSDDIAFQSGVVAPGHAEVERRILYQRFVDYFGPINWTWRLGPFTLANLFTPALSSASSPSSHTQSDTKQNNHPNSAIHSRIVAETTSFFAKLETDLKEKERLEYQDNSPESGISHNANDNIEPTYDRRRLVLLSPQSLFLDDNSTCSDVDQPMSSQMKRRWQYTSLNNEASLEILLKLKPNTVVSRGGLPGCTLHHSITDTLQTMLVSYSNRGNPRPRVLVIEARNATLIESVGMSSLLPRNSRSHSSHLSNDPTSSTSGSSSTSKKSNSEIEAKIRKNDSSNGDIESSSTKSSSKSGNSSSSSVKSPRAPISSPYELNTIFFDATTYLDMKGPYIWLFFLSILGCMLRVDAGSGSSEHYATSTLIETSIAIARLIAHLLACGHLRVGKANGPHKDCLNEDVEVGNEDDPSSSGSSAIVSTSNGSTVVGNNAISFNKRISIGEVPKSARIARLLALRLQITFEVMLTSSIIVVPWCIFVMFRWM